MNKCKFVSFILMVLIVILTITPSFAKFTLTPSISLREEYNDNIFLTNEEEEEDFITRVYPNLFLTYTPGKMMDFSLNYGLDYRFYSNNSGFNDTDLKEVQIVELESHIRPFKRFFIDVFDVYKEVPIDVRRKTVEGNPLVNKTESNTFTVSPYLEMPLFSTVSATVGSSYSNTWYEEDEALDFYSLSAFATLRKTFSSKLFSELRYNFYGYRVDFVEVIVPVDDYDRHMGSVAVNYQITSHINLDGEIGEARYKFKVRDDSSSSFFNVAAEYSSGPADDVIVRAYHSATFHDATTSGTFKRKETGILMKRERAVTIFVKPYYRVEEYIDRSREDRVLGVTAGLSRSLSERITVALDGLWEDEEFLPANEEGDRYSIRGVLTYRLKKSMFLDLGYRYAQKNSNLDTEEFVNNSAWIEARLSF